eukprot:CAMPEP_0184692792 /NCGR_PEP_ID=MMETSP0313-20130426/1111_1 /TAXON_ID=2792 /ORGANISM="Porphyridium aerugineum, Strain SAG 1380-2" /LENGTH=1019 /DNA_ID=CAMNT_0027150643 /DNA_START=152 /DNA_END=3211 /DNA_ORIENTATION=-
MVSEGTDAKKDADVAAKSKAAADDTNKDAKKGTKDAKGKSKDKDAATSDLSEEDQIKKEQLDLLAERARDSDPGVQKLALETIRTEIRTATSSMTSVPKPLKFLREHYVPLKNAYQATTVHENKVLLADILSVLAMTMAESGSRESLHFKLEGSTDAPPDSWGHEYVRSLCGEIGQEYAFRLEAENTMNDEDKTKTMSDLMDLVKQIVPFLLSNNAQPEAVDLLMEVDSMFMLSHYVDHTNFERVCLYLLTCAAYLPEPEDREALEEACKIYLKCDKPTQAMRIALKLNQQDLMEKIFLQSPPAIQKQLAFDLARQNTVLTSSEVDEPLKEIMSNAKLSHFYLTLAKDLQVTEPKLPEDIYKSHLVEMRPGSSGLSSNVDSARQNLASTFVNAFVNMGFGEDKLMSDEEAKWIYRNKEHGMMSAAASLGMILMWDVDGGLGKIDKYMYSQEDYVKAGALLAVGILSAGVRNDCDPALALLSEHVESGTSSIKLGSVLGLGIAYAGTAREDLLELLVPIVADGATSNEICALTALSLGLIFVGSASEDLAATLLQVISERAEATDSSKMLKDNMLLRYLPLALGLVFLGRQEACEAVSESIKAIVESTVLCNVCTTALEACAYAGTGNVLKIQKFLALCGEQAPPSEQATASATTTAAEASTPVASRSASVPGTETPVDAMVDGETGPEANGTGSDAMDESPDHTPEQPRNNASPATPATPGTAPAGQAGSSPASPDSAAASSSREADGMAVAMQQSMAALGIAMISMQEEVGSSMAIRLCAHLLQYGSSAVRRTVPLMYGLLLISNPQVTAMETLSKLSHDSDAEVALTAILGLGLIGAGTNNSRVAGILRQLSSYYSKDLSMLFMVRISQGLLHAAKGLITMNPLHSERFLMNRVAMSGLLTVLYSAFDLKSSILGKYHFLLYMLSLTAKPRMLFCIDEEKLEPMGVNVRVGTAVDTVGQAGRPKSITGFQTHAAPVLLSAGERAELATEEYMPVTSSILEHVVIVKKNPDYVDDLEK